MTTPNTNMLALIMDAKACTAWRYSATDKQWHIIFLKGDESLVHHHRADTLDELLQEVAACLNDGSLQRDILHILVEANAVNLMLKATDTLRKHHVPRWQWLDLAYWQERAAQGQTMPEVIDLAWQGKYLLPLLVNAAPAILKIKPESPKPELLPQPADKPRTVAETPEVVDRFHALQKESERLTALNGQYMEQIRALHAELESKSLVNPSQRRDTLIAFLPVIFKDFWNKVTPAAVASLLHASPQQLPEIPSPYPNPDMATVLAKKKQFNLLPPGEQQGIWQFCTLLDYHHLTLHAEFRPLFEAWLSQNGSM